MNNSRLPKIVVLAAMLLLLVASESPNAASRNQVTAMTIEREKFTYAVGLIDARLGAEKLNKLDVTHVFRELLPHTKTISEPIRFFREVGGAPIRTRANNKSFIYFSFPDTELRKFGARNVVRGDTLVISYETSDLSDDAEILVLKATLVNGSVF